MNGFLTKLWSRKLWILFLGLGSLIGGMVSGVIPVNEGMDKIYKLIIAYLAAQGAVDVAGALKNNKEVK